MYKPFIFFVFCLFLDISASGQEITGKWKTIDDSTGEERSVVEIFERNGKIYGRIIKLLRKPGEDPDPVCDECDPDDPRFRKKVVGMEIIKDMERSGTEYDQGTILDPESGKVYRCRLWVDGNELRVRGYWGPFFRTQTWKKVV